MSNAVHVESHGIPAAPAAVTAGGMLAAAREAQNLSLADVANRLKLSVSQVEALERGAYEHLPGPVFVRGFTRNYARLLRLDPDVVTRALEDNLPRATAEEAETLAADTQIPMPGKSRRWPLLAMLAAVIFLGAALVDVLWPEAPPPVTTAPVPAPASGSAQNAVPMPAKSAEATPPVAAPNADAGTAATAQATPAPETAPTPVPATYQPAAAEGSRSLKLVFEQQSWVKVTDRGGKVVFEQMNASGTEHELAAQPPLALVIGNARGVRLIYGGRAMDLTSYMRGNVARLTLE